MTTVEQLSPDRTSVPNAENAQITVHWFRLESLLDRVGDRLNPILVKEARQAMKSRQFIVTFALLLVFFTWGCLRWRRQRRALSGTT